MTHPALTCRTRKELVYAAIFLAFGPVLAVGRQELVLGWPGHFLWAYVSCFSQTSVVKPKFSVNYVGANGKPVSPGEQCPVVGEKCALTGPQKIVWRS
jgi:hypothetical protein